jgi:acetyltransferase-like isoleucine patch superfamily enzyme
MTFQQHPQALVESQNIGSGTRVWAFAHVLPGARIGTNCNVCDHVFIENNVIVGDRVTIKCGVQLWDGLRLEDDVFVGPNATFTNDKYVRSKKYPGTFAETIVKRGASIGANATVLPGVTIGRYASIGAGTVVTRNVPDHALVIGNPGRITGYVDKNGRPIDVSQPALNEVERGPLGIKELGVGDAFIHEWRVHRDLRGSLSVGNFGDIVPFHAKRFFFVYNVPGTHVRGAHSHRTCKQFLICCSGSLSIIVENGRDRVEVLLDRPNLGLYLPAMIWSVQYKHSTDAVLSVFASEEYDPSEYIRDYDEYLELREHFDTLD